ncbi:MAG TPA: hypothetical protein G4O03_03240 [Dehalococcoidia bacterium]|jgi:glycogen debranching enzyme|nr:hypothetical protein [Dehalococcoidia bacterium]
MGTNVSAVDECYQKALQVLKANATEFGFKASKERYNSIWGRDGSITSLGASLAGDEMLIDASRKTLLTLKDLQTPLGQVPNTFYLDSRKVNFYSIDATALWIIAVAHFWSTTRDRDLLLLCWPEVERATVWLQYQVIDSSGLVNSPPAGDWMDSSLQRWGKVLYNNLLYYKALVSANRLAAELGQRDFAPAHEVRDRINLLFWPKELVKDEWLSGWSTEFYTEVVDPGRQHYLNYLSFESYDSRCDVAANCLAILWDVADAEKRERILGYMSARHLSEPFPIRVLEPPILQPDTSWNPKIDLYRPPHWQNLPFCYHNAAIWPWVGGFYIAALVKAGKQDLAREELEALARANRVGMKGEWEFNEWLHGRTGRPMGAALQSWSASGYILAYKAVTEGILP